MNEEKLACTIIGRTQAKIDRKIMEIAISKKYAKLLK